MSTVLLNVVLSYPHLFKPQPPMKMAAPDSVPKYGARLRLQNLEQIDQVNAAIQEALVERFPTKVPPAFSGERLCLRQDPADKTWFVATSNAEQPGLRFRGNKEPVTLESPKEIRDKFYPGAIVNAAVRIWVQDNDYGKRVNASLEGIQWVKDGDRIGHAPVDLDEAFPELPPEDTDLPF